MPMCKSIKSLSVLIALLELIHFTGLVHFSSSEQFWMVDLLNMKQAINKVSYNIFKIDDRYLDFLGKVLHKKCNMLVHNSHVVPWC